MCFADFFTEWRGCDDIEIKVCIRLTSPLTAGDAGRLLVFSRQA